MVDGAWNWDGKGGMGKMIIRIGFVKEEWLQSRKAEPRLSVMLCYVILMNRQFAMVKYSVAFVLVSLWPLKRITNEEAKVPHQPADQRSPCRSQSYRKDREWRNQTAAVRTLFPMRSSQRLVYPCEKKQIYITRVLLLLLLLFIISIIVIYYETNQPLISHKQHL